MRKNEWEQIKTVTIFGSFRKHYKKIIEIIDTFEANGITVLSPKKSEIINPDSEFVVFKSDVTNDPLELENIHLNTIEKADIIYVCDVDGYIGFSTAFEIGYALRMGHTIYFLEEPKEIILSEIANEHFYSKKIINPEELCCEIKSYEQIMDTLPYYWDNDNEVSRTKHL